MIFFVIVALVWDGVSWYLAPEDGPGRPGTAIFIGVLLALPLIALESSTFAERFRRLPFWAAVLLKTTTYVAALATIFLGVGLVNDFFHDVSGPVLDTGGEIYQYVGDEVVITWPLERGVADANCVRAFFQIDDAVGANAQRYQQRYGAVPDFKAAVHSGEVIAAEIGDLKKDIAFNGEVLNLTARIRGECARLDRRLLGSRSLYKRLDLPLDVRAEPMGAVSLRGVAEPTEIVAFA